ncbi:MAG: hypothetical protein AAF170_07680 [Bacteroidota bacterium]
MRYKVLSPVRVGSKTRKPGDAKKPTYVTLDKELGDGLVEKGVLAEAPARSTSSSAKKGGKRKTTSSKTSGSAKSSAPPSGADLGDAISTEAIAALSKAGLTQASDILAKTNEELAAIDGVDADTVAAISKLREEASE